MKPYAVITTNTYGIQNVCGVTYMEDVASAFAQRVGGMVQPITNHKFRQYRDRVIKR